MKKLAVAMVASLLMALALGSTCFAGTSKGETAFSIAGSVASSKPDHSSSTTNATVLTGINYFLMDTLSVGGQFTYFGTKPSGSSSTSMTYINLDTKYHFMPKSVLVPYVGILAGIATMTGANKGTGYDFGAMAGANYFLMENASLDAELNYRKDAFKVSGSTYKQSTTTFLVGLTYYFGK